MPLNPPDFARLIQALNKESVRYVLIGGMAMVLHGCDSATVDTEFAVASEPPNTGALVRALAPFHPRPAHLAAMDDFPWDAGSVFGSVISLVTDVGDVDLLCILPGVDTLDGLVSRAEFRNLFDEKVPVASVQDLIAMKLATDRPKDCLHIIELQTLAQVRDERV